MAVRAKAEMLDRLASILGSAEEKSVRASGGPESKLVQSQSLTAGLLDPRTRSSCEPEGSHRHLGDGQEAVVVRHGPNDNNGLALVRLGQVGDDARERNGRAVDPGHEKPTQNHLVEVGIGTACRDISISIHTEILYEILGPLNGPWDNQTYGPRSGRASPGPSDRHSRFLAPGDGCCAHGGGPGRYLLIQYGQRSSPHMPPVPSRNPVESNQSSPGDQKSPIVRNGLTHGC